MKLQNNKNKNPSLISFDVGMKQINSLRQVSVANVSVMRNIREKFSHESESKYCESTIKMREEKKSVAHSFSTCRD
jgi:hypothetical protein